MHGEVGQRARGEVRCVGDQAGGEIMVGKEDLLEIIYCIHLDSAGMLIGVGDLVCLSRLAFPLSGHPVH